LQGSRVDTGLVQLARSAGGRGETFDLIALCLCRAPNCCQCGRFARAGEALDALNAIRRTENIFDHALLRGVEMQVLIGKRDGIRTRKNWFDMVLSLTHSANNFTLRLEGFAVVSRRPGTLRGRSTI